MHDPSPRMHHWGRAGATALGLTKAVEKARSLAAAWPAYPPYENRFPDPIPHLTCVCHSLPEMTAILDRMR